MCFNAFLDIGLENINDIQHHFLIKHLIITIFGAQIMKKSFTDIFCFSKVALDTKMLGRQVECSLSCLVKTRYQE